MNKKMKAVVVVIIGGIIIRALYIITGFPFLFLYFAFLLEPNPPKPEITYGEFPFKLVYEKSGEEIIAMDTLICKFDGFWVASDGKCCKWKESYASGNDGIFLCEYEDLKLYFYPGSGEYHMGGAGGEFTGIECIKGKNHTFIDEKETLEKYGIKIISWEIAPPIENSLK